MDGVGFARCSGDPSMPVGKGDVLTPNEVVRVVRRFGVFTRSHAEEERDDEAPPSNDSLGGASGWR